MSGKKYKHPASFFGKAISRRRSHLWQCLRESRRDCIEWLDAPSGGSRRKAQTRLAGPKAEMTVTCMNIILLTQTERSGPPIFVKHDSFRRLSRTNDTNIETSAKANTSYKKDRSVAP